MRNGYWIEIILIPSFIATIIFTFKIKKILKKKENNLVKMVALPHLIHMLSNIGLREVFKNYTIQSKTHEHFNDLIQNYLENNDAKKLENLDSLLNLERFVNDNFYGYLLNRLLIALYENFMVGIKPLKHYCGYYEKEEEYNLDKNFPILKEYYFITMKTKTLFMYISEPRYLLFAGAVLFNYSLDKMILEAYNIFNTESIIDRSYGNLGLKFGRYLVLIFKYEIDQFEFNEFIRIKDFKSFDHTFEPIYAGISKNKELVFDVIDSSNEFKIEDESMTVNFIIFKNLDFKES